MIAITSKCRIVKMWQMIINGYEFWKSFCVAMYMSGGARRCSVQSPPTVCARHCQYLSAVTVNICRLSLSKFDTVTTVNICHCYYCAVKKSEQSEQSEQLMQSQHSSYCSCCCRCCRCYRCCRCRCHCRCCYHQAVMAFMVFMAFKI